MRFYTGIYVCFSEVVAVFFTDGLFAACAVVGKYACRRVVDVAALPFFVWHPEIDYHIALTGVIFFKYFTIEEGFLCEGRGVSVVLHFLLKFFVGILLFGVFLEVINHGMPDGIGERRFFTVEYIRRQIVALKGVAEKIFAYTVGVELLFGIYGQHIFHKIEVAERNASLKRI